MASGNGSLQYEVELEDRKCHNVQECQNNRYLTVWTLHFLCSLQDEMLGSVKAAGAADWSVLIMDAVTTKVTNDV